MLNGIIFIILLITSSINNGRAQNLIYLNGLYENDNCDAYATCKKIKDCNKEFQNYKNNQTQLRICSFDENSEDMLICCPVDDNDGQDTQRKVISKYSNRNSDILDFEKCRDQLLKYRTHKINLYHYINAMSNGLIPINTETCDYFIYNLYNYVPFDDGVFEKCSKIKPSYLGYIMHPPADNSLSVLGDRPNMAALGLMQMNNKVHYVCGGSVITERYIITAAHCKYYDRRQLDIVRLGDRFLLTAQDDEYAQQLKIESFILHPDYNSLLSYNDIAMIKTSENIVFTKYVVPSCIDDLDIEQDNNKLAVTGYGQNENWVATNILTELDVYQVPNEECNRTFQEAQGLPYGILESQICIKSFKRLFNSLTPDTCPGDSGSPLKFYRYYDIKHSDFNKTFHSTVYKIPTVMGIVSFGTFCTFDAPSVYTKLSYYRDWMKSVIDNN